MVVLSAVIETLWRRHFSQAVASDTRLYIDACMGLNAPPHLVIVKGTEFFDGKQGRYVDFAITDVLQMIGRAGRPQFDDEGVAAVLVHQPKNFYKFLYEPFLWNRSC